MHRLDQNKLANILCVIGACAITVGCGSGPSGDGSSEPSSNEPTNAAASGGGPSALPKIDASQTDPNASGERHTLCGIIGGAVPRPETYSLSLMNAKLLKYPDFASAIGMARVSTCDEARAFMTAYNDYLASYPGFDEESPSKEGSFQRWIEEGIKDPDQQVKILGGVLDEDLDVVMIVREATDEELQVDPTMHNFACSASRLAGPLFLTSAHCLPNLTDNDAKTMRIWIKRARGDGTYGYYGNPSTPLAEYALLADGMHVHGYLGDNDTAHDLAIVHVRPESEKVLSKDGLAWHSGFRLSTRTPAVGDQELLMGWGASTETESPAVAKLHVPDHPVQIQGVHDAYLTIPNKQTNGTDSVSMCRGDSGGPARLSASTDGSINGVLSGWTGIGDPLATCTQLGVVQNWTRVDKYLNEIQQIFYRLQKGLRPKQYVCKFHFTGVSTDPEDINAYFLCNGQ